MKNLETWQPKEGDLVWHKFFEAKVKFLYMGNNLGDTKFPIVEDCELGKHIVTLSELEPYTGQDKKIDFSIPEQWLKCNKTIIKTSGRYCKMGGNISFGGCYLGQDGTDYDFSDRPNWQLLTAEQMRPILEAHKALMESRSD
jgi:hypothetical protein